MYNNRRRHRILAYYINEGIKRQNKSDEGYIQIPVTDFVEHIKDMKGSVVLQILFEMTHEGYFELVPRRDSSEILNVKITKLGTASFVGSSFLKKNRDLFWKNTMDISLTLANIVVAITAVWAILKSNNEIPALTARMNRLEIDLRTKQDKNNLLTGDTIKVLSPDSNKKEIINK